MGLSSRLANFRFSADITGSTITTPAYPQSHNVGPSRTNSTLLSSGFGASVRVNTWPYWMDYRTTPLESCNLWPVLLSMNRRPRNELPVARKLLRLTLYDGTKVRRSLDQEKEIQRHFHDNHVHLPGDPVRMAPFYGPKKWLHATVDSRQ